MLVYYIGGCSNSVELETKRKRTYTFNFLWFKLKILSWLMRPKSSALGKVKMVQTPNAKYFANDNQYTPWIFKFIDPKIFTLIKQCRYQLTKICMQKLDSGFAYPPIQ